MNVPLITICVALLACATTSSAAEPTSRPARPIVLGPDDHSAFPPPPAGFDKPRAAIAHGRLETVEYDSKTVGTRRKMLVYTPPGYTPDRKYNVLFLLHGIGGDETEWRRFCAPDVILDNLYADGKLAPMIVCFPNGRAEKDDRARGNIYAHMDAFANFTGDLLDDVVPFVESRYPVYVGDRAHRALAGFSMGGGQTLNIGLTHLDAFANLGGFSSAPNTRPIAELIPDADALRRLDVLYLACGNRDGLIDIGQNLHALLKAHGVPHVWSVNDGGHDGETWKIDLFQFAKLIFKGDDARK